MPKTFITTCPNCGATLYYTEDDIIDANISGMEHICCTVCNSNVVHKESNIKIK